MFYPLRFMVSLSNNLAVFWIGKDPISWATFQSSRSYEKRVFLFFQYALTLERFLCVSSNILVKLRVKPSQPQFSKDEWAIEKISCRYVWYVTDGFWFFPFTFFCFQIHNFQLFWIEKDPTSKLLASGKFVAHFFSPLKDELFHLIVKYTSCSQSFLWRD